MDLATSTEWGPGTKNHSLQLSRIMRAQTLVGKQQCAYSVIHIQSIGNSDRVKCKKSMAEYQENNLDQAFDCQEVASEALTSTTLTLRIHPKRQLGQDAPCLGIEQCPTQAYQLLT